MLRLFPKPNLPDDKYEACAGPGLFERVDRDWSAPVVSGVAELGEGAGTTAPR
jgi:hypothetical protein